MIPIKIIISSINYFNEFKLASLFNGQLRLDFKTEDEYLKFLNNPKLTINDFNIIEGLTNIEEINKIIFSIDIKQLLKDTPILIELSNINDLPIKLLETKKKVILNIIKLDYNNIIHILSNSHIHENVLFIDKYNEGIELTLKDMISIYQDIYNYAYIPLKNNYSQIESFYYIYNLTKERIYKEENIDEDETKSRSLIEILNGDKIVCVGYCNLFAAISHVLGLNVEICFWENKELDDGHASIIVYINDTKYNICGIYAIDPTWDSKRNEDDVDYVNSIRNFLIPLTYEEKIKEYVGYKPLFGCSYYRFIISKENCMKYPNMLELKKLTINKGKTILNNLRINNFDDKINLDELEVIIKNLGNQILSTSVLKDIITTVTLKSRENLDKTINTSIYSKIEEKNIELLLREIFKK